ncbi:MAG: hypothetical protein CMC15_18610 [Flavobacteriaceae bacterium]|nr:hypothetical protein [Flavobacteriaceae bacterium]
MEKTGILLALSLVICGAIAIYFSYENYKEHQRFLQYVEDHNCKIIETIEGECHTRTTVITMPNGSGGVTTQPHIFVTCENDKNKYQCDNNDVFWK